jgi:hypothetical protein
MECNASLMQGYSTRKLLGNQVIVALPCYSDNRHVVGKKKKRVQYSAFPLSHSTPKKEVEFIFLP